MVALFLLEVNSISVREEENVEFINVELPGVVVHSLYKPPPEPFLLPDINSTCRAVTGCLKPTNVEDLYLLAGVAPPDIRRDVCARVEKTKQETNEAHSLYGQNPAESRLEWRNCFLRSVKPADFPPKVIRCSAWLRRLQAIPHRATVNKDESLAKGFDRPWTTWR